MTSPALSRLLDACDRPQADACWMWRKATDPNGYGRFWLDGGMRLAHRVAYQLLVGPIPAGRVLDHLCRAPGCINPAHLEVVTQRQNVNRGASGQRQAARTHCPQDHEYTDANTYRRNGSRFCRRCHNDATRVRRRASTTAARTTAASPGNHHTKENQ